MNRLFLLLVLLLPLTGCVTNPVTGASDFVLYGRDWDISTGAQQYSPSQQSQGGEYVTDPALSRYVNSVGQKLAAVSDNPLPYEFVVLNNSVPNAWALPGGKIAVNRGLLLELENEAELAAVLAHEVVHAAARHGAQAMSRGMLLQGAMIVGVIAASDSQYSDYVVGASALGSQLITQRYGRDAERQSDEYGIRYMIAAGYDPRASISLQETFVRLSEGRDSSWLNGLFASHPPSEERVENNRRLVNELVTYYDFDTFDLGEGRYQEAISHIRETAPAYDLYDEAVVAINDDQLPQAMNLIDQAIALEPAEARLHGLKGDIFVYQKSYQQAIDSYDRALGLHGSYYDYYLGRGVAYARVGNRAMAKSDLEQSARLLPTSIAANELGKMSLADNNIAQAKQYFQLAAQGQGGAAAEARNYFARLDLRDNPNNYLKAELSTNSNGQILVRVSNPLDVGLRDVVVAVQMRVQGINSQVSRSIPFMNANSSITVNTGAALPQNFNREQDRVISGIVSAEVARF